jgi:hypothetical protein
MPRPVKMFRSKNDTPEHLPEKTMFGKPMEEWGFPWYDIDHHLMSIAVASIAMMDCAILFAAAAGGRGVACKLYQTKLPQTTVCLNAREFDALMNEYIDHFGSKSEDTREAHGYTKHLANSAD